MTELVWEDPPEPKRVHRVSKFVEIVEELKAHEGKWALLYPNSWVSNATFVKKNLGAGFEVVTRRRDEYANNHADVYARYVGAS